MSADHETVATRVEPTSPNTLSSTDLIQRASSLRDLLVEKGVETQRDRRLAPEVFEALGQRDLLSVGAPAMFGGHDVDLDTMFEITYELGRGCASTAWVWSIWALHNWFMGFGPRKLQEELFANGPDVVISSSYNPAGAKVTMADGGCLLSGSWGFSSGIDYARWVMLGATPPGMSRPAAAPVHLMLVPRDEVTVVDDWHVMGLEGTGSKSVLIEEPVFVPSHRFLETTGTEGIELRDLHGRASYAVPHQISQYYIGVASLAGAAKGALDILAGQLSVRKDSWTGARTNQSATLQSRIGHSAAELDAIMALARSDLSELLEWGRQGIAVSVENRATHRLHHCYCLLTVRQAVTRLFEVSGTAGMFKHSPLQRVFADIYSGSKHSFFNWDKYSENYGRVRLGVEPLDWMGSIDAESAA